MGHPWEEGHHRPDATTVAEGQQPLLEVENLEVHFPIRRGILARVVGHVKAVDGISLQRLPRADARPGRRERAAARRPPAARSCGSSSPPRGRVEYDGVDMATLGGGELRKIRRQMQIIFQDPYGSLNPRMTVESTLTEPMVIHRSATAAPTAATGPRPCWKRSACRPDHLRRYPHEFSGGQRQRICIARALAVEPDFIICDESVSALDVSVQAQVLNLLKDLQERRGLTYIFISHDLSVVKFMADMMAVMNDGKIVEFGPSENIYVEPKEDYTRRLIEATPKDDIEHLRASVASRQAQWAAATP